MAKIAFNQLLEVIRGRIKGLVIRQRPDGTFILSGAPRYRKGKATPQQKAYREHFRKQTFKARELSRIHPLYAELANTPDAKGKWLSAYNFALADCLKPPVIHHVERHEGRIRVEATDNIKVDGVQITMLDEQGQALARGMAVQGADEWWEFPCEWEWQKILVEAWDIPGNVARVEL